MVKHSRRSKGITLTELLIVVALIGVVFAGAISMYTSSLKFLGNRQAIDVTTSPDIVLEQVTRKVSVANSAGGALTQGNTQLNIRLDFPCGSTTSNQTPSNFADDSWQHYRLTGSQLLSYCDATQSPVLTAPGNPAGTVALISNLNTAGGGSTFALSNPSASGNPTVVSIHLVSTNPVMSVDTEASLGAAPKR